MPVEVRQRRERLIDVAFLAVIAAGFLDHHAALDPRDVAAFAAEFRFADVTVAERRGEFVGGQQIGMVGKQFPENRQQTFVAEQHFPGRLDELDATPSRDARRTPRARAIPTDTSLKQRSMRLHGRDPRNILPR